MDETVYWTSLEFRVCRELAEMSEKRLRYLWCDGFIAERLIDDPTPRITGRAWICNGPRQEEWQFTLLLHKAVGGWNEIEWDALLPAENVTRWLAIDLRGKLLSIEPAAGMPEAAVE